MAGNALIISLDTSDLGDMAKTLSHIEGGLSTAIMRAINTTLKSSKVKVVKEVRAVFNVDAGAVKRVIKTKLASADLYGELYTFGPLADKSIPLIRFDPRPSGPSGKRPAAGTSVLIKKTEGRQSMAGSFLAEMPTGHVGVYKRAGKPRLPIYEQYGPSVGDMLEDDDIYPDLQEWATEAFQKRVKHEVEWLLRKSVTS